MTLESYIFKHNEEMLDAQNSPFTKTLHVHKTYVK